MPYTNRTQENLTKTLWLAQLKLLLPNKKLPYREGEGREKKRRKKEYGTDITITDGLKRTSSEKNVFRGNCLMRDARR